MGWGRFEGKGSPVSAEPVVSIQKRGMVSINEAAVQMMGSPEEVELMFDPERKLFALHPAPQSPHAYHLRKSKSGTQRMLSATAFMKLYNIDMSYARRYTPFMEEGMLCIDLSDELTGS